jgi:hypothetical protein
MAIVLLVLEPDMVLELVPTLQQQLVVDMVPEELLELGDMVPEEVLEPGVMALEEVLEPGVMVLEEVLEEVLEPGVMVLEEVLEPGVMVLEELLELVAMAQGQEARQELELLPVSSGKRRA